MYCLLRFVPKNHLSWCVGKLAAVRYPFGLSQGLIRWYANRYQVNLAEAEFRPEQYPTLAQFFTRRLKEGSRLVGSGVVSPVDGCIVQHGVIDGSRLIQAKGKFYDVGELLGDRELGCRFHGGYFVTIYLAPGDYHRIHAPVDGTIRRAIYVEGNLWPVNDWSVQRIDNLFSRNERLTTIVESAYGTVAIVKVGATNVGAIKVCYDSLMANQNPRFSRPTCLTEKRVYDPGLTVRRGDELGIFQMGSTVILLFENNKFDVRPGLDGKIKMGEQLNQ